MEKIVWNSYSKCLCLQDVQKCERITENCLPIVLSKMFCGGTNTVLYKEAD